MRSRDHEASAGGRRTERLPLDAEARLKPNSWSSLSVRVLDLSGAGFRAECEARVRPGSCVTLDVPGLGEVDAQVEWQRAGEFGARFLVPIDLDRCEWTFQGRHQVLARLLVQRAAAKHRGHAAAEARMRQEIQASLFIRKGSVQA